MPGYACEQPSRIAQHPKGTSYRAAAIQRAASALVVVGFATACGHPPSAIVPPLNMVQVPRGTYRVGTDPSEFPALLTRYHTTHVDLFASEAPRRMVTIGPFVLDRTEVTNAAFGQFLRRHPEWQRERVQPADHNGAYLTGWTGAEYPAGRGAWPVSFITWTAAEAYCRAAGKRLPSEAEWEVAARGGLAAAEFPWGDAAPDPSRANWLGSNVGHPVDVGHYPPNGYGLFDMAGNVWEFTSDSWPVDPTRLSDAARREGPGGRYVIRGGSYGGAAINLRVRYRDSHPSGGAGPHVGFRCARGAQ